jgi:hypothetical protein
MTPATSPTTHSPEHRSILRALGVLLLLISELMDRFEHATGLGVIDIYLSVSIALGMLLVAAFAAGVLDRRTWLAALHSTRLAERWAPRAAPALGAAALLLLGTTHLHHHVHADTWVACAGALCLIASGGHPRAGAPATRRSRHRTTK